MTRLFRLVVGTTLLLSLPAIAAGDWSDSFTDYADGSEVVGQGGWEEWGPGAGGTVTSDQAFSAPHSLNISGGSDVVHQYSGYDSGQWAYTAWNYVPDDFAGLSYFILLNQYGVTNNWSTQIRFDSDLEIVESEFEAAWLPLITGEWVKLQVLIDFDTDTQEIYYGGSLLSSKSWVDGVSGGGIANLAAVDLYANGATPIYWDAMSLGVEIPEPTGCLLFGLLLAVGLRRR